MKMQLLAAKKMQRERLKNKVVFFSSSKASKDGQDTECENSPSEATSEVSDDHQSGSNNLETLTKEDLLAKKALLTIRKELLLQKMNTIQVTEQTSLSKDTKNNNNSNDVSKQSDDSPHKMSDGFKKSDEKSNIGVVRNLTASREALLARKKELLDDQRKRFEESRKEVTKEAQTIVQQQRIENIKFGDENHDGFSKIISDRLRKPKEYSEKTFDGQSISRETLLARKKELFDNKRKRLEVSRKVAMKTVEDILVQRSIVTEGEQRIAELIKKRDKLEVMLTESMKKLVEVRKRFSRGSHSTGSAMKSLRDSYMGRPSFL